MTDPAKSQYDEHPFDPNDHSHDNDPKPDLGNTDSPDLKVAWDTHPSFNLDPTNIDEGQSGDPGPPTSADAQDFKVGYEALGTQVNQMLQKARGLIKQYEDLRTKVKASEGAVFGQASIEPTSGDFYDYSGNADGSLAVWQSDDEGQTQPTVFAKPAKDFAAQMNPQQDKALQAIGSALEVVGEYIALVNHSGQVYAAADRQSAFPPPPSNGVTA